MSLNRTIIVGIVVLILSACSNYPLNMSEEEWQALTAEQQLAARQQQAELDEARALRRAREAEAKAAEAERAALALQEARKHAAYGDNVQCVFSPVQAYLNSKWRTAEPLALDLVRGYEHPVTISEQSRYSRYSLHAVAYFDGQVVELCPEYTSNRHRCARLLANQVDYQRGVEADVASDKFIKGRLRCALPPRSRRYDR